MKRHILVLAIITLCFIPAETHASSLFGKVIEVNSGDVITIFNLNRPVRVRLLGVDAPEMNQAFGDVAKQHLSDLVLEKSVLVEYSGIAADSSLSGRVLLNTSDIGAQMIRDGAAWFDPNNGNRLSPTDRDVYQQSEQAARSERRGLWRTDNPMAPWEFVKAEALRRNPVASLNAGVAGTKPKRNGPVPELTNLTLMSARMNAAAPTSPTGNMDTSWSRSTARKNWSQMQVPGEDFSVLIPEGGQRMTTQEPVGAEMVDVNSYMVRDGWAAYSLAWYKGPTYGETDQIALTATLQDLLKGAALGYESGSGLTDFSCKPRGQKNISQSGYTGIEYDLSTCSVPGKVRVYTKVVDNLRQLYIAMVLFAEEDENVGRFLTSFTIGPQKSKSRVR